MWVFTTLGDVMKKAVLMSIKPKWCEKIFNGKKLIEIRKSRPELNEPFTVYVYCTKEKILGDLVLVKSYEFKSMFPNQRVVGVNKNACTPLDLSLPGYVIGEFTCNKIEALGEKDLFEGMDEISNSFYSELSCVDIDALLNYKGDSSHIYAWHISDILLYDTPKSLAEFNKYTDGTPVPRAPQSYMFVEDLNK